MVRYRLAYGPRPGTTRLRVTVNVAMWMSHMHPRSRRPSARSDIRSGIMGRQLAAVRYPAGGWPVHNRLHMHKFFSPIAKCRRAGPGGGARGRLGCLYPQFRLPWWPRARVRPVWRSAARQVLRLMHEYVRPYAKVLLCNWHAHGRGTPTIQVDSDHVRARTYSIYLQSSYFKFWNVYI